MDRLIECRNSLDKLDTEITSRFEERMRVIKSVAEYKKEKGIAVLDKSRETEILNNHMSAVSDEYKNYFNKFYSKLIDVSKSYQNAIIHDDVIVTTDLGSYNIVIQESALKNIKQYLDVNRKTMVITDSGVPQKYVETVLNQIENSYLYVIPQGEKSKNIACVGSVLDYLIENEFCKDDCIIALGGGVVGDISGFVSSIFERGIDLYNIPTTLLAMVDSSVGGKNGINYSGYKNQVGTFYQPKTIIIDPEVLNTLTDRQISNGLVESLKMAMTSSKKLFDIFVEGKEKEQIEQVIRQSINIKKSVVEEDVLDNASRRVLNFGHTIGHAIESLSKYENLYHGECVAIGIMMISNNKIQEQLKAIYKRLNLPTSVDFTFEDFAKAIAHDKKKSADGISEIYVDEIGGYRIEKTEINGYKSLFVR